PNASNAAEPSRPDSARNGCERPAARSCSDGFEARPQARSRYDVGQQQQVSRELRRHTRRTMVGLRAALALGLLAVCAPALAQQTSSRPTTPTTAAQAEAEQRYRRALDLFDEGNFEAALLELRRAYELAPTYRLLYNIAIVNVGLKDYVRAIDYFERYLK